VISPGLLETAGIPILKGRRFTADDRAGAPLVAIINESMARRFWPGADPTGKKLRLKDDEQWLTVAGVVPEVKHMGLKEDEGPVLYIPYAQKTQDWLAWTTLIVRTAGEPMDSVAAVRSAIHEIDPNQPIAEVGTLEELLDHSMAVPRFSTAVICVLSAIALTIAFAGVYGLISYAITQSARDLAIRMTLGASASRILWLLFRRALLRAALGIAAGIVTALWLAQWIRSLLFEVHPHDPAVFAGVAGLLLLASALAVMIPAQGVMKIDPAKALRME
jgi:putative ABC transport system permease protein